MATWADLETSEAELATIGRRLLWPSPFATSFLATTRADGGPRVHPVVPVLVDGRLYVFVVNMSPKHADLLRDGRFALHALPPIGGGEEFYVTGRANRIEDASQRAAVRQGSGGLGARDFESLFELDIEHVLYTHWRDWGTPKLWPEYHRWHASKKRVRRP